MELSTTSTAATSEPSAALGVCPPASTSLTSHPASNGRCPSRGGPGERGVGSSRVRAWGVQWVPCSSSPPPPSPHTHKHCGSKVAVRGGQGLDVSRTSSEHQNSRETGCPSCAGLWGCGGSRWYCGHAAACPPCAHLAPPCTPCRWGWTSRCRTRRAPRPAQRVAASALAEHLAEHNRTAGGGGGEPWQWLMRAPTGGHTSSREPPGFGGVPPHLQRQHGPPPHEVPLHHVVALRVAQGLVVVVVCLCVCVTPRVRCRGYHQGALLYTSASKRE